MIFYLALCFLIPVAFIFVFLVTYALYSIFQEYRSDRVPALLYHRFISKEKIDKGELIDPDRTYVTYDTAFDEQMAWLKQHGYHTISLDVFLDYQDGKGSLPPKPILVTCDDGFMSNYVYAFPVLKKYQMQATIFVTPDHHCANFKKYANLDSPLTHEQLTEMSDNGVFIESHAMTHRYLTELEDKTIEWELAESKQVLEEILGKPVSYLAIPSGTYNKTVRQLAKKVGYKAVFGMLKGSNNLQSDRYALRRVVIGRDFSLDDFKKSLEPGTTCQLRLTSFFQNILLKIFGPTGLDALRDFLHRTGLVTFLVPRRLQYLVSALAFLVCVSTLLGVFLLFSS